MHGDVVHTCTTPSFVRHSTTPWPESVCDTSREREKGGGERDQQRTRERYREKRGLLINKERERDTERKGQEGGIDRQATGEDWGSTWRLCTPIGLRLYIV